MEDLIHLRRFDPNGQTQGIVHGIDLGDIRFNNLHLLFQSREIILPRVEEVGLPAAAK
jgi:hypothetical protein